MGGNTLNVFSTIGTYISVFVYIIVTITTIYYFYQDIRAKAWQKIKRDVSIFTLASILFALLFFGIRQLPGEQPGKAATTITIATNTPVVSACSNSYPHPYPPSALNNIVALPKGAAYSQDTVMSAPPGTAESAFEIHSMNVCVPMMTTTQVKDSLNNNNWEPTGKFPQHNLVLETCPSQDDCREKDEGSHLIFLKLTDRDNGSNLALFTLQIALSPPQPMCAQSVPGTKNTLPGLYPLPIDEATFYTDSNHNDVPVPVLSEPDEAHTFNALTLVELCSPGKAASVDTFMRDALNTPWHKLVDPPSCGNTLPAALNLQWWQNGKSTVSWYEDDSDNITTGTLGTFWILIFCST